MAQRTRAPSTATGQVGGYTVEQLTGFMDRLVGRMGPTHPVQAPSASGATQNILTLDAIITVMRGSRPAEGTPERRVWDAAIGHWQSSGSALDSLTSAHADLIGRLAGMDIAGVPEESRPRLAQVLGRINANIYNSGYEAYLRHANAIVTMTNALGGEVRVEGEEAAAATAGAPAATTAARQPAAGLETLPPLRRQLSRHGTMRPLGFRGDTMVMAYQTELTNEIRDAYGCTLGDACSAGVNAINLIAEGFSYRGQSQDMNADAARDLARRIGSSLAGVRSGHALREDPNFTQAIQAFNEGRLNDGLNLLQQSTSFNGTLLPALGRVHSISVNAEAITMLHAGAMIEIPLTGRNQESMRAWLSRAREDSEFAARLGYLAVGIYYQMLRISGQDIIAGTATPWSETGHVLGFNTELGFAAIANRTPLEIILHASLDFTNWEHTLRVPQAGGTTRDLTLGQNWDVGLSIFGLEVRTPAGVSGERSRIDLDAVGISGTATGLGEVGESRRPEGSGGTLGVAAYVQFSGEWYRGDQWSVTTQVMPQVRYLLNELRAGGRVDLVQIGYNMRNHMIGFGGGVAIETAVYNAELGEWGGRTRAEYYGTFGYTYAPRGITATLRGGVIQDYGALGGTVTAPTFTLNVGFDERLWSGQPEERSTTAGAVPVRTAVTVPSGVRREFDTAASALAGTGGPVDQAAVARTLGGSLRGWVTMSTDPAVMRFGQSAEYRQALEHLDAGRLQEGMDALRRTTPFRTR